MERRSLLEYIYVGTAVRFLIDVESGWEIHGDGMIIENIDNLRAGLERAGLLVSVNGWDIAFKTIRTALGKQPAGYTTTKADAKEIENAAKTVREMIDAEAMSKFAFFTSDRRYPVDKLLDNVAGLLGDGIYHRLSEVARIDLQEAGRCIVFNLPTAAAFHALRATEEILRRFYERSVTKKNRLAVPWLWKSVINDLAKRPKPPVALLQTLDNIRFNQRNPTDHPEKVWDIDEAQDVFGLCIQAIREMIKLTPPPK